MMRLVKWEGNCYVDFLVVVESEMRFAVIIYDDCEGMDPLLMFWKKVPFFKNVTIQGVR